jgi:tetratricopeptide (TPR) repeat protein
MIDTQGHAKERRSVRIGALGALWIVLVTAWAAGGLAASPVQAQAPEDRADREALLEEILFRADEARAAGEFRRAIERYEEVLAEDPDRKAALDGVAACYHAVGRYADEETAVARRAALTPDDRDAACRQAEYRVFRGRLEEAEAIFRKVLETDSSDYRARFGLARLLRETGRREEAEREFRVLADHAATHYVEDAPRLTWLGRAYWALGGFEEAASAFADAIQTDPLYVPARQALGDLLLEKYQAGDALREYRLALEIRAEDPDLVTGLARAYYFREQYFDGRRELERALSVNPSHPGALVLEARARFEDRDFAGAREAIDRILAVNPRHKEGLSLRAAHHYLLRDRAGFEKDVQAALAIDPHYGGAYLTTAEVLGGVYRFADGLPFAEKALEIDPTLWRAHDVAGRFCFNTGRHEEGTAHLRKAQDSDNFRYPWRLNMLEVSTIYDEFLARPTNHFEIYLHVDEARVLRGYLEELLEECYAQLTRRYRFVPESPTIVEVFPDKDDFAVRNVGMPGIDYILGICFGRVVTLNSPASNPPGSFSWAQTAWHEFAHVLTLQISKARIPRWLTEGISVYEERRANPTWVRRQELDLVSAYCNDKIFPLRELNWAFRTPRIGFAYYQGSLLVEFIEETRGFDAILKMLRLYGEDLDTDEIILQVLEMSSERFDREFVEWVGRKIEHIRVLPPYDADRLREFRDEADLDPDNADLQAKLAWAYYRQGGGVDCEAALGRALELDEGNGLANLVRGFLLYDRKRYDKAKPYLERGLAAGVEDAFARLRLAGIHAAEKDVDAAIREYEKAKRNFPEFVGPGNAYLALERIYLARDEKDKAMRELRAFAELDNTDLRSRRLLADWYREKGDLSRSLKYLVEILWVNPLDPKLHVDLADTYRDLGRREDEAKELRVGIELAESDADRVSLTVRLAEVERELGREEEARFLLEQALRLDPENAALRAELDRTP